MKGKTSKNCNSFIAFSVLAVIQVKEPHWSACRWRNFIPPTIWLADIFVSRLEHWKYSEGISYFTSPNGHNGNSIRKSSIHNYFVCISALFSAWNRTYIHAVVQYIGIVLLHMNQAGCIQYIWNGEQCAQFRRQTFWVVFRFQFANKRKWNLQTKCCYGLTT